MLVLSPMLLVLALLSSSMLHPLLQAMSMRRRRGSSSRSAHIRRYRVSMHEVGTGTAAGEGFVSTVGVGGRVVAIRTCTWVMNVRK